MRKYLSWVLFHKPERHYHLLSYRLAETACRMNELNDRRRRLQSSICELTKGVDVCSTCGACCMGNYDHHTAVDFLVRAFSDDALKGYGELWRPKPIHAMVADSLRPGSNIEGLGGGRRKGACPHLGSDGCSIPVENRPIRCVLWTCRAFRKALPDETFRKLGALNRELDGVSKEVMRVLRGRR